MQTPLAEALKEDPFRSAGLRARPWQFELGLAAGGVGLNGA